MGCSRWVTYCFGVVTIYRAVALVAEMREEKKNEQNAQECGEANQKHHSSRASSSNMQPEQPLSLEHCSFHIVAPWRGRLITAIDQNLHSARKRLKIGR
jgi:hypothetical protein